MSLSKNNKHNHEWYNDRYNNIISCYDPSCRKKANIFIRNKIKTCPKYNLKKNTTHGHIWIYNEGETWWTRRCSRCSYHQILAKY